MLLPGGTLTLDLGSRFIGWCLGYVDNGAPRQFGTWEAPTYGGQGAMFAAAQHELRESIAAAQPRNVIFEAPLTLLAMLPRRGKDGQLKFHTNMATVEMQLGLQAVVKIACHDFTLLPPSSISADKVRDEILGQSHFPRNTVKSACIRYCRERGWKVNNSHEADAVLIFEWYRRRMTHNAPAAGPLWRDIDQVAS